MADAGASPVAEVKPATPVGATAAATAAATASLAAESAPAATAAAAAAAPASSPRQRRVLCLHGWRTSSYILQAQTMFLRSKLPKSIELVMLQAPIETSKPADKDVARVPGPYYQWWMDAIDAAGPEDVQASAQKALEYAAAFVSSDGPFDAVLGFSQGAAMATMLTNFLARKREKKQGGDLGAGDDDDDAGSVVYPWHGTICVCAGSIPCKAWEADLLSRPLQLPSLHMIGERDKIRNKGEKLFKMYAPDFRHMLTHSQGHRFPPMGDPGYTEFAKRVTSIVFGRGLPPVHSKPPQALAQ